MRQSIVESFQGRKICRDFIALRTSGSTIDIVVYQHFELLFLFLHTCIHTCIHTYIHTYIHTDMTNTKSSWDECCSDGYCGCPNLFAYAFLKCNTCIHTVHTYIKMYDIVFVYRCTALITNLCEPFSNALSDLSSCRR